MLPYVAKGTADVIKGKSWKVKKSFLAVLREREVMTEGEPERYYTAGLKMEKEHHKPRNKEAISRSGKR